MRKKNRKLLLKRSLIISLGFTSMLMTSTHVNCLEKGAMNKISAEVSTGVVKIADKAPKIAGSGKEVEFHEIKREEITAEEVITTETPATEVVPVEEVSTEVATGKRSLGVFYVTSYCSCAECCGCYAYNRPRDAYGNEIVYGASGEVLTSGYSIAVDTSVIPFGTRVEIDGVEYIAQDVGGAIQGNRIDVYNSSHAEALNFPTGYYEVFVKE